jgi:hypothetical protein
VCVVVQGVGAGELVPGGAVAGCPGLTDGFGLFGFDRAGCEAEFALGDAGPDECGGFLSFAVVEGGLDWSWDGWQLADDLGPGGGEQPPGLEGVAAVLVVEEARGGPEVGSKVVEGGGEARACSGAVQPLVEVVGESELAAFGVDAEVGGGVAQGAPGCPLDEGGGGCPPEDPAESASAVELCEVPLEPGIFEERGDVFGPVAASVAGWSLWGCAVRTAGGSRGLVVRLRPVGPASRSSRAGRRSWSTGICWAARPGRLRGIG